MTNNQYQYQPAGHTGQDFGPVPPLPPVKKQSKKIQVRRAVAIGVTAAALGIGALLGSGSAKTEIQTVEVPKEVTKTVTKEVPTTPQACLDAISYAEQGFDYAAQGFGYSSDAIKAVSEFDVAGIQAANAGMQDVQSKMAALNPLLQAAKADCRAAQN